MKLVSRWVKQKMPATRPRCPAGCFILHDKVPNHTHLKFGLHGVYCPQCGRKFVPQVDSQCEYVRYVHDY
jgi:hypothetical protein